MSSFLEFIKETFRLLVNLSSMGLDAAKDSVRKYWHLLKKVTAYVGVITAGLLALLIALWLMHVPPGILQVVMVAGVSVTVLLWLIILYPVLLVRSMFKRLFPQAYEVLIEPIELIHSIVRGLATSLILFFCLPLWLEPELAWLFVLLFVFFLIRLARPVNTSTSWRNFYRVMDNAQIILFILAMVLRVGYIIFPDQVRMSGRQMKLTTGFLMGGWAQDELTQNWRSINQWFSDAGDPLVWYSGDEIKGYRLWRSPGIDRQSGERLQPVASEETKKKILAWLEKFFFLVGTTVNILKTSTAQTMVTPVGTPFTVIAPVGSWSKSIAWNRNNEEFVSSLNCDSPKVIAIIYNASQKPMTVSCGEHWDTKELDSINVIQIQSMTKEPVEVRIEISRGSPRYRYGIFSVISPFAAGLVIFFIIVIVFMVRMRTNQVISLPLWAHDFTPRLWISLWTVALLHTGIYVFYPNWFMNLWSLWSTIPRVSQLMWTVVPFAAPLLFLNTRPRVFLITALVFGCFYGWSISLHTGEEKIAKPIREEKEIVKNVVIGVPVSPVEVEVPVAPKMLIVDPGIARFLLCWNNDMPVKLYYLNNQGNVVALFENVKGQEMRKKGWQFPELQSGGRLGFQAQGEQSVSVQMWSVPRGESCDESSNAKSHNDSIYTEPQSSRNTSSSSRSNSRPRKASRQYYTESKTITFHWGFGKK